MQVSFKPEQLSFPPPPPPPSLGLDYLPSFILHSFHTHICATQTFSPARLSSLPAIFLSFSFIAHAAPAGVEPAAELEHTYDQLTEAKALVLDRKPQVSTSLLLDSQCAESSTNPSTHVDALVGLLNTCTRPLSGVSVSLDASAKAEIAQLVADILVSISRSYNQISFKVGSAAYLALWAKLDLALQLLLLNLHFCLGGMLKLVADLLASATVGIFAKLKLPLLEYPRTRCWVRPQPRVRYLNPTHGLSTSSKVPLRGLPIE